MPVVTRPSRRFPTAWRALPLALLCLAPLAATARVSGRVALLSDYVWRGISESGGNPALQAAVTAQGPIGLYARAFVSTLDYQGAFIRADFSGGIRNTTPSGLGFNVGATAYRFDRSTLNFEETFIRLRFGPLSAGVFRDWQHGNTYFEAGYRAGLGSGIDLVLHAGHTSGTTIPSYSDFGLGVEKSWHAYAAGLFVTTIDRHAFSGLTDTRVAFVISRSW